MFSEDTSHQTLRPKNLFHPPRLKPAVEVSTHHTLAFSRKLLQAVDIDIQASDTCAILLEGPRIRDLSRGMSMLIGRSSVQLFGQDVRAIICGNFCDRFERSFIDAQLGEPAPVELALTSSAGSFCVLKCTLAKLSPSSPDLYLLQGFDTTEEYLARHAAARRLERLRRDVRKSEIDQLTDLYNQQTFAHRLARKIAGVNRQGSSDQRSKRRVIWLLYCDYNYFKELNDKFGQTAGNAALRHFKVVADRVFNGAPSLMGRINQGDEFGITLEDLPATDVYDLAFSLMTAIAQEGAPMLGLEVAIGIIQYEPGWSLDDFMDRAFLAMKYAKEVEPPRPIFASEVPPGWTPAPGRKVRPTSLHEPPPV